MRRFSAIYIANGQARRMTFEAANLVEAQQQAAQWGVGVEGETPEQGPIAAVLPEAVDIKTAGAMLGGISRSTLKRLLWTGKLQRLSGSHKVLITRQSIERFAATHS